MTSAAESPMNNKESLLSRLAKFFDRRGFRWGLSLAATIYSRFQTGTFIKVFFDGAWGHRNKSVVFFDRRINLALSYDRCRSVTMDHWLFLYKPKQRDVIIDIGAGLGVETFFFSKLVGPEGKIFSIEANPPTFACLQKMSSSNKLDNVVLLNLAIHHDSTSVYIDDPEVHVNASILNTKGGYEVSGETLDSLVRQWELPEIAFVKMNIEGAERLAVRGMTDMIKMVKYLCISCHDFISERDGNEYMRTKKVIREFLADNGLCIVTRDDDPRAWIRDQLNAYNPKLCQPSSKLEG